MNLNNENNRHEFFMREALKQAEKALDSDDVPIGAVIVEGDQIIGRGYNQIEKTGDPTAHAEMLAIREAVSKTIYKHLLDSTIYVTLEPCIMCSGAIVLARIPTLVYGAVDPKTGASGSLYTITEDERLNHHCTVISGILPEECSILIKDFFRELRKK